MLSIHNNLSAGTQNVTGAYVIIMLVYRHMCMLTAFTWQSSCVIANNAQKTAKAICPRLEVQDVIKYKGKQDYITCKSGFM